jgi:hydrogenase expression/formation protein HypD
MSPASLDRCRAAAAAIHAAVRPGRTYRFMEFCGGHTHAALRHGLPHLLPTSIHLIHGPGCPVCVLPLGRLEQAIRLAERPEVTLCTYGDLLRVPAAKGRSLLSARAAGADVRMVLSPVAAVDLAQREPQRQVVFLAIGFETTAPATAVAVQRARRLGLTNFSILCNHVLTPPAARAVLAAGSILDGIIGPGHVALVTGANAFAPLAAEARLPVVISGFEPHDLLESILALVRLADAGIAEVAIQYDRAATAGGNGKAQAALADVFALRERFPWRGLGEIPHSAYRLADATFDAETRFACPAPEVADHPRCRCAEVVRGACTPAACSLFGTACTPEHPQGSCMVSPEGACSAWYSYRLAGALDQAVAAR